MTDPVIACAIQTCLSKNGYQDSKCQDSVRALYECCTNMYARLREEGKDLEKDRSDSCPLPYVVERRMKAMSKGAGATGAK